tara:strand:+ start:40 stop:1398 length:1359 start_codon:yes stop_codon:yes gene_type:complete
MEKTGGSPESPILEIPRYVESFLERFVPSMGGSVHWGLERIGKFLKNTGNPHVNYPVIHVGGTNGKGSVAASLASVLGVKGHSVGLYTSPHLCSFNERIQLGSKYASDQSLRDLIRDVGPEMERCGLSFFEAVTGLAFHMFEREGIDLAVVEVGLGGRLDATNVVRPISTVITNIEMDHKDYLGETKKQIAKEKLGIVKEGIPLFTSESDEGVIAMFEEVCRQRNSSLFSTFNDNPLSQVKISREGTSFTSSFHSWGEVEVVTPLIGKHQAMNTCLALSVLDQLPDALRPEYDVVAEGIRLVDWPGRTQVENRDGVTWVLDIAHNKAGAVALVETLKHLQLESPSVLLVSVLSDKDWEGIFSELVNEAEHVILTQSLSSPSERRWDLNKVSAVLNLASVKVCPDFNEALMMADRLGSSGSVVVTGSAHTVGDVLNRLDFEPNSETRMVEVAT